MIDVTAENLLTIRQAATLFPGRNGRPINLSTVWRWILDGRRGVKLESIVGGGTRYVSRESIQRFIERLNPEQMSTPTIRTRSQRQRASERAAKELQAAGI